MHRAASTLAQALNKCTRPMKHPPARAMGNFMLPGRTGAATAGLLPPPAAPASSLAGAAAAPAPAPRSSRKRRFISAAPGVGFPDHTEKRKICAQTCGRSTNRERQTIVFFCKCYQTRRIAQ